jgi:DNA-binding FrmR family transcriptional regulator
LQLPARHFGLQRTLQQVLQQLRAVSVAYQRVASDLLPLVRDQPQ